MGEAFHFTPVSMATVFEPGLISRALLVGISSIPSSFEDWSLYGRVYALLCGLFRMRGALFEHNPSVLPSGCGFSSVLYGRSKWPVLCLCGLLLLFVTRVSATSNALSFVRGEERWCVSCSSPQRYPLLFDTSLSSPSFTSVLFRQVLFGELLITSFLVALFFLPPAVSCIHPQFFLDHWRGSGKSRTGAPTFQTPLCRRLEGGQMLVRCIVSHCLLFWLFFCLPCLCRYFFCLFAFVCLLALLLVLEIFLGRSCLSFISSISFASALLTCLVPIIS